MHKAHISQHCTALQCLSECAFRHCVWFKILDTTALKKQPNLEIYPKMSVCSSHIVNSTL